jgi:hypothetical protein
MMIRDWYTLWLMYHSRRMHVRTDPACRLHRPPRHGSRLDRASRGVSCHVCNRWRNLDAVLGYQIDGKLYHPYDVSLLFEGTDNA